MSYETIKYCAGDYVRRVSRHGQWRMGNTNLLKIWSGTLLTLLYLFKIFPALLCCRLGIPKSSNNFHFLNESLYIVAFSVPLLVIVYLCLICSNVPIFRTKLSLI